MSDSELHWEANDLVNKSIFSAQLDIESYKTEIKECERILGKGTSSAIHLLAEVRKDLEIFEYVQSLLDQVATEKSTLEKVRGYVAKARKNM
jgi:hypothetical protein